MSKANTWETGLLALLFTNAAFTLVGDAAGLLPSAGTGNLFLTLHTADPGETGDQTTSEATYTSYARVAVVRSAAGWTLGTGSVTNAAVINFPACTGGSNILTHFGIGTATSGASKLLYSGALTSSLAVSNGIAPSFAIGSITITED